MIFKKPMKKGKSLEEEGKRNSAILIYRQALNSAIEANQVKPLSESLKRLGAKVDLPKHFGFFDQYCPQLFLLPKIRFYSYYLLSL